jgi:hypothetical protein
MLVAAATNRVFVAAGQPVPKPEIGRLRDDWELRAQDLPSPTVWEEAARRAQDMGIVPTSTLLSANTVADLGDRLHHRLVEPHAQAVGDLVPRLEAAYARLNLDEGDRLRTAKAASGLVDDLLRRPDAPADVLASAPISTTAAALGTSIAQADSVAAELERTNWELLRAAWELAGPWEAEAGALRDRLAAALHADELAVPLVARLREAAAAATDLLAKASKRPTSPPPPPLRPTAFDRAAAQDQLEAIRERLRSEAHLDLTWQFTELDDDGTS